MAAKKMEEADTETLFHSPGHPYTQGLLKAIPSITEDMDRLPTIPGNPPSALIKSTGCPFNDRCDQRTAVCSSVLPELKPVNGSQSIACHVMQQERIIKEAVAV